MEEAMNLLRRIRYWLRRGQYERELAEEIDVHRSLQPDPRAMGNVTLAREDARAVWIWPWLQSVAQDAAYALRGFRRNPGFALTALVALGTAIGLNASLFTVYSAVALRPWDVKDPGRMVRVFARESGRSIMAGRSFLKGFSVAEFRYLSERSRTFDAFVVTRDISVRFGFEPFGESSRVGAVAGDHFEVLGLNMTLGRGFLPEEDRLDDPVAVVVLSQMVWREHYGSDPEILGKQVRLDEVSFTVVGVAPRGFRGLVEYQVGWIPLPATLLFDPGNPALREPLTSPAACCQQVAGRLVEGVTREEARVEIEVLSSQFRTGALLPPADAIVLGEARYLTSAESGDFQRTMLVLFLGVTLVVALACANVGNLLIARAAARQREIEVRRAVGAGRARLIRQLLTESLVLALGAAAIGVALAYRIPSVLLANLVSQDRPPFALTPDVRVLAYAVALAMAACLCFGLAPALHGTRERAPGSRLRLRNLLLATQVALSVVLLAGAGLVLEDVRGLATRDPGFPIGEISVVEFEVPVEGLSEARLQALATGLETGLKAADLGVPFALTQLAPAGGAQLVVQLGLPGRPRQQQPLVANFHTTPGYFETLGIPIVAGRDLRAGETGAILVNQTLAERYWPDGALGQTVDLLDAPHRIVGIARDTYSVGIDQVEPVLYRPFKPGALPPTILVRSRAPAVTGAIEAAAVRLEPGMRARTRPLSDNLDRLLDGPRLGAEVAGIFGIYALSLAAVGMFGVFAYAVQQRTKEIGIRMALGARPSQVIGLVLRGSSLAMLAGFLAGMVAAAASSRLLVEYLHEVSPLDVRTYVLVSAILAAAALAASYLPSRRAARIDPMAALRQE
jgi:predicted permease